MKHFNVRIYGLLIQDGKLLVSDELINGKYITKLPGGGLEFGEGTKQCLIREFKEELDLLIDVEDHFYTTDFFVESAFNNNSQVISIYYTVKALEPIQVKITEAPFQFERETDGAQAFRWIPLEDINESNFTFVIDKHISALLNNKVL